MRRSPLPALALSLLVGCMIAAGLWLLHDTQVHNCRQVELVKAEIHTLIQRSLRTLGQPGSAGYAYYAEHPAELRQAKAAALAQAAQFAPRPCD